MVQQVRDSGPKVRGIADIVFCVDSTGSMTPFLDAVKGRIEDFVTKLGSSGDDQQASVDWRIKVVGYRDVDADGDAWLVGLDHPFTDDPSTAKAQLETLTADGGGDEPESLLDALYKITVSTGSNSEWRDPVHKIVVVFTDATSKESMSDRVVEAGEARDAQYLVDRMTTDRIRLIYYGPTCAAVETLANVKKSIVKTYDTLGDGLAGIEWADELDFLRRTISQTTTGVVRSPTTGTA